MPTAFPGRAPTRARLIVLALAAAVVAAALGLAGPGGDQAAGAASVAHKKKGKKKYEAPITVMTRNVYLGADLGPALNADSLPGAINGAGKIYREIERTNFPERSVPLGEEILGAKPDLVGLQEVALWREQSPSDGGWTESGGFGAPATAVKYDFLSLLMDQVGHQYRIVGVQHEFDAELPADVDDDASTGTGPLGGLGADLDARLTMRDVILVRRGSKVRAPSKTVKAGHFEELFTAPLAGGLAEVTADRGWLSVEATYRKNRRAKKNRFRFVNTHLEAFGDPRIREAQARELFAEGGPLDTDKKVVLVGDLNSGLKNPHNIGPGGGGSADPDDQLAFKALKQFGMRDKGAVQSCCYRSALNDPTFRFTHTVDHVLVKPNAWLWRSHVTGNRVAQMTPSGLWPSDHGGVVSRIRLKKGN